MSPQPSIVPLLLVVLVPLKDTGYRRTLSRTNEGRYLARESSTLVAARIFQGKYLSRDGLIPRNIHWGGGGSQSHVADSSVIGEKSRPICWRDVLNDPWNCFYQSVRILTIFTGIFPSFSPTVCYACVFQGIVTFDLDKGKKDLDYLFWRKLFRRVFDSFLLVENEMLIDLIFWLYSIISDRIISLFKAVIANRCVTMHWKNCENSYRENFAKIFNIYWYSYVAPFAMFFTYKFFETII